MRISNDPSFQEVILTSGKQLDIPNVFQNKEVINSCENSSLSSLNPSKVGAEEEEGGIFSCLCSPCILLFNWLASAFSCLMSLCIPSQTPQLEEENSGESSQTDPVGGGSQERGIVEGPQEPVLENLSGIPVLQLSCPKLTPEEAAIDWTDRANVLDIQLEYAFSNGTSDPGPNGRITETVQMYFKIPAETKHYKSFQNFLIHEGAVNRTWHAIELRGNGFNEFYLFRNWDPYKMQPQQIAQKIKKRYAQTDILGVVFYNDKTTAAARASIAAS
jgi:hypothetical protein